MIITFKEYIKILSVFFVIVFGVMYHVNSEAATSTMCSNEAIPSGFVVTAVSPGGCGVVNDLFTITDSFSFGMCALTSVPTGYIATSVDTRSNSCGGVYDFYQLKSTANISNAGMCAVSSVPKGFYAATSTSSSVNCGGVYDYYSIRTIENASAVSMCAVSSIPDGYVPTSVSLDSGSCYTSDIFTGRRKPIFSYFIRDIGNNTSLEMCNVPSSSMPINFVATSISPLSATCGNIYNSFSIRDISNQTTASMCGVSFPPLGFEVTSETGTNSATCGSLYPLWTLAATTATPPPTTPPPPTTCTYCINQTSGSNYIGISSGDPVFAILDKNSYSVYLGKKVTLDGSQSHSSYIRDLTKTYKLTNYTYSWLLGDGKYSTGPSEIIDYQYTTKGSYNLSLEVTNVYGVSDTANATVTIYDFADVMIPILSILL